MLLMTAATASYAAEPFYANLLTRGVADVQRGDYAKAVQELRVAAFGTVNEPAEYLRAQIYLATALTKLGETAAAATAVTKAAQAERINARYAALEIDGATRTAFQALAAKTLTAEQLRAVPAFAGHASTVVVPFGSAAVAQSGSSAVAQTTAAAGHPERQTATVVTTPSMPTTAATQTTTSTPAPVQPSQTTTAATAPSKPAVQSPVPAPSRPATSTPAPVQPSTQTATAATAPSKPAVQLPTPAPSRPATSTPAPVQPSTQTTTAPTAPSKPAVQSPTPAPSRPATSAPAPVRPSTQTATSATASRQPNVQVQTPAPQADSPLVAASRHQPSQTVSDAPLHLIEADRLLNEGKILAARQIYLRVAQNDIGLPRPTLLAVAKGLNQTSAWRESSMAYRKVMPFRPGEEMHQFYEAVNRYELGDVAAARDLMMRVLPSLPLTRETSFYRAKILGMQ
jgi:hypothetical protein